MKQLFHLSAIVCLSIVFITASPVSKAGFNGNNYDLIYNDCMKKSVTSPCAALWDYLSKKVRGGNMKATPCIRHLKSKGVKDPLAKGVCRWYFNDK